jgi:uncharacterized protein (TIGR02246 family)
MDRRLVPRLVLLLALSVTACVHASVQRGPTTLAPATALAEVTAMMSRSAESWNHGQLDRFVDDYEPAATYVGRDRVLRGRDAIRGVYAARFAPGGQRDSLSFEAVEVDVLGSDVVHTIAWYRLTRGDSTTSHGPTSLLMRRSDGRWRIVHDHSS